MAFDIPNYGDTAIPEQARLYAADLQMLTQTASLTGTKSGLQVAAQGSPNMTVQVGSGEIYWLNSVVAVAAGNVTITAANATNPRIDLVVVDSSGVKSAVAGTAAAVPTSPAIPANSVVLAQVFVPANDTTISTAQIKDRRIVVQVPSVAGATNIVRKTAIETVASSATLQDDNHLFFTMTSNGIWQVKCFVFATSASNAAMKFNWSVPAGGSYALIGVTGGQTASQTNLNNSDLTTAGVPVSGLNAVWDGFVTTGATAGDFRLRWAQSISNASGHSVNVNSWLEYRLLT